MLDEILELTVGAPAAGGGFVAHAPDGRVVFVRHAISGERVRAIVTEETKSYLRADAVAVLVPSDLRVTPRCEHAGPGRCGGCDWQHVAIEGQRQFKADRIKEHLHRLAGIDIDISVQEVPGDNAGYHWRTRVGYGVDADGHVGFRRYRSHEIELIDDCPLATRSVDNLGIAQNAWPGVLEVDAFCSVDGHKSVVKVDTGRNAVEAVPAIEADLVINHHIHIGKARIENTVLGRNFSISAGVFWQVHPGAATTLGRAVLDAVGDISGARVLDLYCGAGLFTALLARAVGPQGEIFGIERDRKACQDARHNTADFKNVSIMQSSVTAKAITSLGRPPSTAVLDPSREGAGRQVIAALCQLTPELKRIVYVSCDPATFARDLRVAQDLNWSLETLQAFDLFPMTEHVELVGVLNHRT